MADDATLTFGYGFQDPTDSADDFAVTCFIVRRMIAQLDTMKLVQVIAVTGGGVAAGPGTVDVLPLVSQVDGAGNAQPHGVVHGVPWTRWQGGTSAFVLDPVVDDVGWVACADRDISVVKESGKQSAPGSYRTYSVADGVYVGGVLGPTPTQYVALLAAGFDFLDVSGNRIQTTSSGFQVTSKGDVDINANGGANNVVVTGGGSFTGALEAATFNVNSGTGTLTRVLAVSAALVFGTVNGGTTATTTATVTGAKTGDIVLIGRPSSGAPGPLLTISGFVSSANTVSIVCLNSISSSVIPSINGTYEILVLGLTP